MNVLGAWRKVNALPGGKRLFQFFLGRAVPYSGSIGAVVEELEPGFARVSLTDRRRVRNHLNSVHAVALMNLAELTSGLSVLAGLPEGGRGIVGKFEIDFLKKARGTLESSCRTEIPALDGGRKDHAVTVEVKDQSGDVVCRATAHWVLDRKGNK